MKIEFLAKNSEELKSLEKIMERLPCAIFPDDISVQVSKSVDPKAVNIQPKYNDLTIQAITGISGRNMVMHQLVLEPDNPYLMLANGENKYLIHFKRGRV